MTESDKILRLSAPIYGALLANSGILNLKPTDEAQLKQANDTMTSIAGLAVTATIKLREAVPKIMERADAQKAAEQAAEDKKAELAASK